MPKNLNKCTQTTKSLSALLYRYQLKLKIKTIEHTTIKIIPTIFIKYSMTRTWTCPKTWENGSQLPKIFTTKFYISLSTPSCQRWSQMEIKRIGQGAMGTATIYDFLTIFSNFNKNCTLTYSKTWGKGPKWPKLLKRTF